MSTFNVKLEIDQGADFSKVCTWRAGADQVPVDLTGCTARLQARRRPNDPELLLELSSADGGIVLGSTAGTVEIIVDAAASEAFAWTTAVYHLEITYPDGKKRRLMRGSVVVSPEIIK